MESKAQSALEYLMTYGWALVVLVIVIAALVFLINPSNVGSNFCTGFPSIMITNHDENMYGSKIFYSNVSGQNIKNVAISGSGTVAGTAVTISPMAFGPETIQAGAKARQPMMYDSPGGTSGSYVINLTLTFNDRDDISRSETASCRGNLQ